MVGEVENGTRWTTVGPGRESGVRKGKSPRKELIGTGLKVDGRSTTNRVKTEDSRSLA